MRDGMKVRPGLTLVLCDVFEEQHPALNMNFDEVGLPMGFGDLLAMNLEATTLFYVAEDAVSKVDTVKQAAVHIDHAFEAPIHNQRAAEGMHDTRLVAVRDKSGIRTKGEAHFGPLRGN